MSTSHYFQKMLLRALKNGVLPCSHNTQQIPHTYAGPPFNYAEVEHWTIQKEFLPTKNNPPQQIIENWREHRVKHTRFERLLFVYQGAADIRVGIDEKLGQKFDEAERERATGLEALRIAAPGAIYFPPGIAFSNGRHLFQENGYPKTATSRTLVIEMLDVLYVSLIFSGSSGIYTTHALEVKDNSVKAALRRYRDEAKQYGAKQSWSGKVLLQKIFFEIVQGIIAYLKVENPLLRNTSWPRFEADTAGASPQIPTEETILWQHISEYIDTHLDYDLNWEKLARELGFSGVHLNRKVQQATGMTVMQYVTSRRIDAAKLILIEGDYPIKGIAAFVGFRSLRSFSNSFKRHTGYSPREYRQLKKKSIPAKKWSYDEKKFL